MSTFLHDYSDKSHPLFFNAKAKLPTVLPGDTHFFVLPNDENAFFRAGMIMGEQKKEQAGDKSVLLFSACWDFFAPEYFFVLCVGDRADTENRLAFNFLTTLFDHFVKNGYPNITKDELGQNIFWQSNMLSPPEEEFNSDVLLFRIDHATTPKTSKPTKL